MLIYASRFGSGSRLTGLAGWLVSVATKQPNQPNQDDVWYDEYMFVSGLEEFIYAWLMMVKSNAGSQLVLVLYIWLSLVVCLQTALTNAK